MPKRLLQAFLFILVFFTQQFAYAKAFIDSQASYLVKYDGVTIGTSTVTLRSLPAKHYWLSLHDQPVISILSGDVLESSTGLWSHSKILPLQYSYNYHYFNRYRQLKLFFNWRINKLVTYVNELPWQMSIEPGVQDKLSYDLQLRQDLIAGKNNIKYSVADGGKIKIYQFKIVGTEIISTPLGTFNTIKIVRLPMPEKENITLWVAKQLDYQIVRVEKTKNIVDHGVAEIISYRNG